MALIEGWFPPSRDNFECILFWWNLYPLLGSIQWLVSWYGMGKTSTKSVFNIPGRVAWFTMEIPSILTIVYTMNHLAGKSGIADLPWQNKVLASMYILHYTYRAVLFPFIQPSMSPIHVVVWANAIAFQLTNATCIGSWLAAYGPTTQAEWHAQGFSTLRFGVGVLAFGIGLTSNYFCDEELREIRRKEQRRQAKLAGEGRKSIEKHYSVPNNGLFKYMLYPHYFMEWIEWLGFWIAGGSSFAPARAFLLAEISAMLPRAVSGKKWYAQKFGEEKIKGKYAIIPGVW